ncbi:hypothetical protein OCS_05507 [Ophiocordyceps sinensis CO18]|uniref:Uncharacterized protein n=1 Tax=Ophiocordyceps sinensis (strain Co18 / CGMCC 3.14243) TaxID=911162 RepID=T5A8P5_OPHSC|nr:hypothetical protein OCS_05507 [Ophiocordyceps sinensis CO18]
MGALALGYAKPALFVLAMGDSTPPVPGHHHPQLMTDASSQAVMNQSRMSPSAVDIEPRGHGAFEDMSPPYEGWEADGQGHLLHGHGLGHHPGHHLGHHFHHPVRHHYSTHGFAVSPNHRGPRLFPPPDGLVTASSTILQSHHPSPPPSAVPFEDRLRANTPSRVRSGPTASRP